MDGPVCDMYFFFSSRRRHTRCSRDWSSDVCSSDLVAAELKKIGPQLVDLKKENKVAILFSADSANAISYMPFSDHVGYMTVLRQMYDALYDLNVEPDFVSPDSTDLSTYRDRKSVV